MIKKFFVFWRKFPLQKQYMYIIILAVFLPILSLSIITTCISYGKNIEFNTQLTSSIAEKTSTNFTTFYNDTETALLDIMLSTEISKSFYENKKTSYYDKYTVFNTLNNNKLFSNLLNKYRFIENITFITDSQESYSYINASASLTKLYDDNNLRLFDKYSSIPGIGTKLQVYCSDFTMLNNSKQKYLSLIRGVYEDQKLMYIMVINLKPTALSHICSANNSKEVKTKIISPDNIVVFDTDSNNIGTTNTIYYDIDPEVLSGNFTDGNNIYFYFTNVHKNYYILVYTAKHNLNNSLLGTIGILIISSLLIGLLIFYIGYVLSNTLLKPISVLTKHIANDETGSFSPIKINTQNNEIHLLIKVYNEMSDKISEIIQKNIEIETEKNKHELLAKNLELEALQTQINPHFIYNTLAIINGYAIENDNDDITEMTLSLSALLRYSLGKVWEKTTLNDEIKQAYNYFSIQKNRQSCMPNIDIDIVGYETCQTTRLFLQPLLENIFLHAFPNGITSSSNISIKAYSFDLNLFIDVSDNGIGMDENYLQNKHSNDGHIGLFNIHRRIQLEYGNAYGCFISKNKTGGTTITVKFPLYKL